MNVQSNHMLSCKPVSNEIENHSEYAYVTAPSSPLIEYTYATTIALIYNRDFVNFPSKSIETDQYDSSEDMS
ncbi:4222_t:CDS:2, partial [Racocetra persica]